MDGQVDHVMTVLHGCISCICTRCKYHFIPFACKVRWLSLSGFCMNISAIFRATGTRGIAFSTFTFDTELADIAASRRTRRCGRDVTFAFFGLGNRCDTYASSSSGPSRSSNAIPTRIAGLSPFSSGRPIFYPIFSVLIWGS